MSAAICSTQRRRDAFRPGATHAWVEALVPGLGWVGLDPTNDVLASDRHVRTAVGRDYADVPPSKGVFKGAVESELSVAVRVAPSDAPPELPEDQPANEEWNTILPEDPPEGGQESEEQQQQQ